MTLPGKTWKDQKRKRGGRPIKTNPSPKEVRDKLKLEQQLRENYPLTYGRE